VWDRVSPDFIWATTTREVYTTLPIMQQHWDIYRQENAACGHTIDHVGFVPTRHIISLRLMSRPKLRPYESEILRRMWDQTDSGLLLIDPDASGGREWGRVVKWGEGFLG
jgi:hypothetical protein